MKLFRFIVLYYTKALCILSLLFTATIQAQTQPELMYHTVQEGETVFRITRNYGMTEEIFFELNPEAKTVLSIGKKVLVYANKPGSTLPNIDSTKFIFHEVQSGETLFRITRTYEVSQDLLESNNPYLLQRGLQVGMVLRIPKNPKRAPIEEQLSSDDRNEKRLPIEKLSEEGYFIHVVEAGETMYSLTRTYDISTNNLVDLNPQLSDGLKVGMRLRIRPLEKVELEQPDSADRQPFTLYRVREGDRMTDILATFNISIQELERFNPRIHEGIKPGRMLLIPLQGKSMEAARKDTSIYALDRIIPRNQIIRVALFLPLDDPDESDDRFDLKKRWVQKNTVSLGFFSGVQMALDSLQRMGVPVSLHVFHDNDLNSEVFQTLDSMDLVIGPFFYKELRQVVGPMRKRGNEAPVVSPVSNQREVLEFPNVYKCIPSEIDEITSLYKLIEQKHRGATIVIIHDNDSAFIRPALRLAENLNAQKIRAKTLKGVPSRSRLEEILPQNQENEIVFVLLGKSKVFITNSLNTLGGLKRRNISLLTSEKLSDSRTLDAALLGRLGYIRPEASFFRAENPHAKNFWDRYQKDYQRIPDRYAYQGFDITYYFLRKISGRDIPLDPLHTYFDFSPTKNGSFNNQAFIWIKLNADLEQRIIHP